MSYEHPPDNQNVNISNVDITNGNLNTDTRLKDEMDRLLVEMKIMNMQFVYMTNENVKEEDIPTR